MHIWHIQTSTFYSESNVYFGKFSIVPRSFSKHCCFCFINNLWIVSICSAVKNIVQTHVKVFNIFSTIWSALQVSHFNYMVSNFQNPTFHSCYGIYCCDLQRVGYMVSLKFPYTVHVLCDRQVFFKGSFNASWHNFLRLKFVQTSTFLQN